MSEAQTWQTRAASRHKPPGLRRKAGLKWVFVGLESQISGEGPVGFLATFAFRPKMTLTPVGTGELVMMRTAAAQNYE